MPRKHPFRLWIPITIIIVLVGLNVLSFATESTMRFIVPPFTIFLGILGLSTWWIFLAGKFRWKFWLAEIGVGAVLILLAMTTLEYDGSAHGGLPVAFKWKWSPKLEDEIGELPAAAENVAINADDPDLADFPAFLGPKQDGVVDDPGLNPDWSANPPEEIWRIQIGPGWSAFSVVGERAVTQEQRGEDEMVTCYHVKTGQLLWSHKNSARFFEAMSSVGPRATPTIDDGVVYALGATGILNAINLETGENIWTRDSLADGGGGNIEWGKSASPVLTEDLVIVTGSKSTTNGLIAYRRDTGEIVWKAGTGPASYSTPQLLEFGGVEQLVAVFEENVSGFDPKTGAELWMHKWPGKEPKVANPLRYNDRQLLITTSYNAPSKLLNITKNGETWAAAPVWEIRQMKTKFSSAVIREGYAYGIDEGKMICMEVETGKRVWKGGRYGFGQNLMVGDKMLIQAERGEVVLVQLTPDEHVELGRFPALTGKTWNAPALAGKYLLVRNDHEAAAFKLP